MDFVFSNHALEQLRERDIDIEIVKKALNSPDQIIREEGKNTYQAIVDIEDKSYLIRIFVNNLIEPNKVITVYITSKIKKYYEG